MTASTIPPDDFNSIKKIIFSTSAKIELSCDIKFLFRKSVDKKLKIFNFMWNKIFINNTSCKHSVARRVRVFATPQTVDKICYYIFLTRF